MTRRGTRLLAAFAAVGLALGLAASPAAAELSTERADNFAATPNHPMMLGDFGAPVWEAEFDNGAKVVDIEATLDALEEANVNSYAYIISGMAHYGDGKTGPLEITQSQWAHLPDFMSAAQERNIDVYVWLMSPSLSPLNAKVPRPEQQPGLAPFGWDYVQWADEIAALTKDHPNLGGLLLDDFNSNTVHEHSPYQVAFTPQLVADMASAAKAHDGNFKLYGIVYQNALQTSSMYRNILDGLVFPYRAETGTPGTRDASKARAEGEVFGDVAGCHSGELCLQFAAPMGTGSGDGAQATADFTVTGEGPYELAMQLNNDDYLATCPDGECYEFGVPGYQPTAKGDYAAITQRVKVTEAREHELSFWLDDSTRRGQVGYHFVQALIDDQVVAEFDLGDATDSGIRTVDVTDAIGDRLDFDLTLRLHQNEAVGNFHVTAWVDDVDITGTEVADGSFGDRPGEAWTETTTATYMTGAYTGGEYVVEILVDDTVAAEFPVAGYWRWHEVTADLSEALADVQEGQLTVRVRSLDDVTRGRHIWIDDLALTDTSLSASEFDDVQWEFTDGENISVDQVLSHESLFMLYASRLAADPKGHQPTPEYIREVQTVGLELINDGYFDGSLIYVLNKSAPLDHPDGVERAIIGELYGDFAATNEAWCDVVLTGAQRAVEVTEGRTCLINADVKDGIRVAADTEVTIIDSRIKGSIVSAGDLAVCGSQVQGGVVVDGADEVQLGATPRLCSGNDIKGGVQLSGITSVLTVANSKVSGSVTCDVSAHPSNRGTNNNIKGRVTGPCGQL